MRNLKVALAAACAVVVGWAFTVSAVTTIPASAYVQDGLIAQWDGIDNAGTGTHDPNATAWKDLKGTRDLAVNAANGGFADGNALKCFARSNGFVAGDAEACTTYRTIELMATRHEASNSAFVFGAGDTSNVRMFALYKNDQFVPRSNNYKWNGSDDTPTYSATYDESSAVSGHYTNGLATASDGNDSWSSRGNRMTVGAGYSTITYPYVGKIFTIRLYDRELSAEELAKNALLDRVRFLYGVSGSRFNDAGGYEIAIVPKVHRNTGGTVRVGNGTVSPYWLALTRTSR